MWQKIQALKLWTGQIKKYERFLIWFLCPSRTCVTDSDARRITLSCNWRLEHYKWRCWVWTMFMVQGSRISSLSSSGNWWMWCKDVKKIKDMSDMYASIEHIPSLYSDFHNQWRFNSGVSLSGDSELCDLCWCCVLSLLQRGFLSWSQQSCLNSRTARPPTS